MKEQVSEWVHEWRGAWASALLPSPWFYLGPASFPSLVEFPLVAFARPLL